MLNGRQSCMWLDANLSSWTSVADVETTKTPGNHVHRVPQPATTFVIVAGHTEICDSDLSFHENKQIVLAVNAISSNFVCMNFNVKKDGQLFFQKYLPGSSF